MTHVGENVSLHISEVFPEDEGTYKCVVSNAGGQAVLSANLKVIGKSPNFYFLFMLMKCNKFIFIHII